MEFRSTEGRKWEERPLQEDGVSHLCLRLNLIPQLPFWPQDLFITSETTGGNRFTRILRTSRGKHWGHGNSQLALPWTWDFPVSAQKYPIPPQNTELFSLKSNHGFFSMLLLKKSKLKDSSEKVIYAKRSPCPHGQFTLLDQQLFPRLWNNDTW